MDPVLFAVLGTEGIFYLGKFTGYLAVTIGGNAKPGKMKWMRKKFVYPPTPIDFFMMVKDGFKIDKYESELRKQNLTPETKSLMMDNFYAQL